MFECCKDGILRELLGEAKVLSVMVDKQRLHMDIDIGFKKPAAPVSIGMIEQEIMGEFGLNSVKVNQVMVMPKGQKPARNGQKKQSKSSIIMGREIKGRPEVMSDINQDSGRVIVRGEVFGAEHRRIEKHDAWVLSFCITDNTNSLKVSKFMSKRSYGKNDAEQTADPEALCSQIKNGMYLTVKGNISYNRYDGDIVLEPTDINMAEKTLRQDEAEAEHKRVELHLHTRFSALDALPDPKEAVALAARFGHPAIAITDHGVAQAFPDAYSAGKKHGIKVIYGIEGYYINDHDDRMAVSGPCDAGLDDEFAVFDLETTGLKADREEITEIGAVICKEGEILDKYQTFVNPGKHIPPNITQLTGISDMDVEDAPGLKEALESFLDFVGDRPLVAHNASFDMEFLAVGCGKTGLDFNKVALDTLVIAQGLLPDMKKYRLNILADFFGLPDFNHHRASDDAITTAYLLEKLFELLRQRGIRNVTGINPHIMELKKGGGVRYRHPKHIIILAKNQAGIRNLYKLISFSHLDYFKRYPTIPKSVLIEHREGLIIGSACEAGEIFSAVADGKNRAEIKRLASFYDYLEIQPLCNNNFMISNGKAESIEELRDFNRQIISIADELGKPVVATGDVHFLEPEQEIYRKIILASKKFPDADSTLPIYFKTTAEMLEEFSYLGEKTAHRLVVENTRKIADMCDEVQPLPDGLFAPKIDNSVEELKSLVWGKTERLYGKNPPEIVRDRVSVELNDIINCHYDVIYMSAQKLVAKSLEAGYLVGSRGSVGSSIVAFMSGITEVNSLPAHYRCPNCKHADFEAGSGYGCGADMPDAVCPKCGEKYEKDGFDIPFATFLGFGGDKIPDIDLNFSGEYQARAHRDTNELFGENHVFRAGTIGTLASKTAYGFVKNYLQERGRTVTRAEENRLTMGCVGVKRTTGQHPGGLVVIPQDKEIYDFCPVQHPADDSGSDIITTHFEYHSMESNLLKLDLLGHDDPTMIKNLEDLTGVDAKKIPLDDPETMSIFKSPKALGLPENDPIIGKTGTIAVPEFGTKFTREMLVDTQPDQFDILVRLSGFSHGTDVWLGNAKDLITSGTATVQQAIGCRDDIMLFLISKGVEEKLAFKIMEAVRKGRGLTPEWEEAMRKLEVPEWYIESCNKIKYMFPKAHAVAYVMMAFRIAWFKVHRPIAFYSAYFSIRAKAFDAQYMCRGIDLAREKIREIESNPEASNVEKDMLTTLEVCYEFYLRGFTFAGIDLYKSDAVNFVIEGDSLIPPFVAVAGLGETAAYDLVQHRSDKDFVSIEELSLSCAKLSSTHIEQLKGMGVFGFLPDTSQISLF